MSIPTPASLAAQQPLPLLVLDFDGTLCLGDGPVQAYADAVAEQIPEPVGKALQEGLAAFLAHSPSAAAYKDGYAAVASLAEGLLDSAGLNWAYSESRRRLAAGLVEISAAPGLADFLDNLSGVAFRILLTNAPLTGVPETLAALGLSDSVDLIIHDAGKPAGFNDLLPALLQNKAPAQLLSVGDVWSNDIDLPGRLGCATAFIDRFDHRTGAANLRAPQFELLFDAITAWAQNPAGFAAKFPSTYTPSSEKAPL
ncbi:MULTISPECIES: HAD family hydrolase [Arthrobacter]|uniref:HAD family hydrolase n=1 Tax=Arthrobacter TaxID=1663 RepID=UPI00078093A1|nr:MULTISPECIES: HAD family hydrolase [Arthrobacter]